MSPSKSRPTRSASSARRRTTPRSQLPRFTDPYCQRAVRYAQAVVKRQIPACRWVRQACKRQLADLRRWKKTGPYEFDQAIAGEWCEFVEHLPHIKGPLAGSSIQLEDWQCFLITTAFGWLRRGTPYRRFRRVYIEVPRGNAKSTLSSGLILKAAFADGEGGAECYSAAVTRDQAKIVFLDAQHMCRSRPDLRDALGVEILAQALVQPGTASLIKAVASESNALDGLNIYFGCIDELHAHRSRFVYDTLETGTGKRPASMLWVITTAGSDRAGICYEVRGYATKVLEEVVQDDALFAVIYTIDEKDDWTKEASWIKANPNWGISVMPETIRDLAKKAMEMPGAQQSFKTKHLNVWVNANQAWMNMLKYQRCADPKLLIEDFEGEECWVGLDLASKIDIAARAALFRRMIEDIEHYYLFCRFWLPEEALHDGRNSQYLGWASAGLLQTTPGDVLDFGAVELDLEDLSRRFDVQEIAYDPWQATQLATNMMDQGAPMVEFRKTVANYTEPMKLLDALIRKRQLHHDGNPVLEWMFSNVVCHVDAKGNIYPRKEREESKIDGVDASISALARAVAKPSLPVHAGELLVL